MSARLVLPPDAPREEWLAARRQGVTASEIAVAPASPGRAPWWRRAWDRLTGPHVCDPREDPIDPTDVRCRICGQRPNEGTAAPADTEAAVEPDGWKEPKDMAIIQRRARDVHAGDVIIRDPDPGHGGKPVRWRVNGRTLRAEGVVIVYYTDVADEPTPGVAWCDALTMVAVESVGGAA